MATQTGTGFFAHWLPFPETLLIAGAVLVVGLLLVVGAQWFIYRKLFVMKPHEVALQEIEIAAHRARGNPALDHRGTVVEILDRYVRCTLRLTHPRMEAEALLKALAQSEGPLTREQRLLLQEVLEAPTAGTLEGIAETSRKGVRFVWATVLARPVRSGRSPVIVGGDTAG